MQRIQIRSGHALLWVKGTSHDPEMGRLNQMQKCRIRSEHALLWMKRTRHEDGEDGSDAEERDMPLTCSTPDEAHKAMTEDGEDESDAKDRDTPWTGSARGNDTHARHLRTLGQSLPETARSARLDPLEVDEGDASKQQGLVICRGDRV